MIAAIYDVLLQASNEAALVVEHTIRTAHTTTQISIRGVVHDAAEIVTRFTQIGNALNNIIFAIRDQRQRSPYQLHHNISIILQFFEANQLVGFSSNPIGVLGLITQMQQYCEDNTRAGGIYLAFFGHIIRLMDMIFQSKIAFSLLYHHMDRQ